MKILIVEDDSSNRILLKKVLRNENHEVILAANGKLAWELIQQFDFDAILTDWMMPEMDGLELINRIRSSVKPAPVIIMITALASKEALEKALSAGADDFITKPINIKEVKTRLENCFNQQRSSVNYNSKLKSVKKPNFSGVCVATSTGGPQTLMYLFEHIKPTKNAAFFIVLHGPAWMLKAFPQKIRGVSDMPVYLAENGMKIEPGSIYLAPGELHTMVNPSNLTLQLVDTPPENFVKPSADPLFKSASKLFGDSTIGIVLTGMGHDGSIGAGFVKAADGFVIAQEPADAILPSMPASVIDLRIPDAIAPISMIPDIINKMLK